MKILLFSILALFFLTSCSNSSIHTSDNKLERPFIDYADLEDRRLKVRPYAFVMYRISDIEILEVEYYSHGNIDAINQIDGRIEYIKFMTQNIRNEHPVKLSFIDGDPTKLVDGNPPGTFKVIKQIYLPKIPNNKFR